MDDTVCGIQPQGERRKIMGNIQHTIALSVENSINFPNLGIYLNNVPQSFTIFGVTVTLYGMIIALGILLGFVIGINEAKKTGQDPEDYWTMGIIGVIAGILGARLYFVIFNWDYYRNNLFSIIDVRGGIAGLAIYGGIIGAFVTAVTYARVKKLNTMLIFDTVSLCLINAQILGRWGNFFNREAFGEYTNNLLAMQMPVSRVSRSDITPLMEQNIEVINGVNFIQAHPTFLYESIWNLVLFIGLLIYRKRKKYDGEIFLLYIFGYGVGRFWIETLRTDQLMLFANVPASLALAGASVLVAGFFLVYFGWKHRKGKV